MNIVNDYISEILFRTKRNTLNQVIYTGVLALGTVLLSFIGFKIMGLGGALLKSLLVGLFSVLPILGSGIIMVPWIIIRLFSKDLALAGQLAIIYSIIVIGKQSIEPYLYGFKVGIRPIFSFVIFLIFYLFGGLKGAVISAFIILFIATFFEFIDIQNNLRRAKMRKRREERAKIKV